MFLSKLHVSYFAAIFGVLIAGCGTASLGAGSDAATVNGQHISMAAYKTQVTYKRQLAALGNGDVDPCTVKVDGPICTKIKQTALNDLINEQLISQYASKHHISVSTAEFRAQWAQVMADRFKNNVPVMHAWLKHFGLTEPGLKSMVRSDVLSQKVMYAVTQTGVPAAVPAVRLARIEVQSQAQLKQTRAMLRHQSFLQVASLLSTNQSGLCYQTGCGDLGWLPDKFLTPAEHRAATAPIGTLIGPLASQQGLTLLRVEGHDPRYHLNPQQQLAWRQGLFTTWLNAERRRAAVHRYVAA
jgi:hypothetical protein